MRAATVMATLLAALACATLFASGLFKLIHGHVPGALVGPGVYATMGVLEIMLAMAFATRWIGTALLGAIALAAAGVAMVFLAGDRPCGCLGALVMTPRQHLLLAGSLGLVASSAYWLQLRSAARP